MSGRWARRRRGERAPGRHLTLAVGALAVVLTGLASPGAAAGAPVVRVSVSFDGAAAAGASEAHPVPLRPDEPLLLEVRVVNGGDDDLAIRTVRFEGWAMGLTFFAYDTRVALDVPAHRTALRRYSLDLVGLRRQATGLIPAQVVVLGSDRRPVAAQSTVVDVRGSLRSVYGGFGLAVAAFTGLSLAGALMALARHRLSPNRWRRGVRFLWPGVGIGLFLVFTLSALRVFVPEPHRWAPLVGASTIVLFALGYLTPTPDAAPPIDPDLDDPDDEDAPEGENEGEGIGGVDRAGPGVGLAARSPTSEAGA